MSKLKRGADWRPFSFAILPTPASTPTHTPHAPADESAEPLPWAISLLSGGVDDPLLRVRVHHLRSHAVEPLCRQLRVPHSPPQLTDEVGEHRPFVPRNAIEALECF